MSIRTLLLAAALAVTARSAQAQRATLESILDLESWKTDTGSVLLARNHGRLAGEARLHLMGGLALGRSIQVLAVGEGHAGNVDSTADAELELLSVRIAASRALTVEGGKILMPMGLFGARRFSTINPVIGAPDLYPTQYPLGVVVSLTAGAVDFRLAAVSKPVVNEAYTPPPGSRIRPLAGIGVRFGPSLHIGAAATRGPYLNSNLSAVIPAGHSWDDYRQTVVSGDLHFSLGYVDTRAEIAWSRYEAPTAGDQKGFGAYVETRLTLSPRVFLGLRMESNDYPFIQNFGGFWVANTTLERNGEIGVGYRISPSWLAKASFRKDQWPGDPPPGVSLPDGYAVAVQLSWHVYLSELLAGRY